MAYRSFEELKVWQASVELIEKVYQFTQNFPDEERKYGLGAQMRRSAVSVASNIAEGQGHGTKADFARFIRIALGSLAELRCQTLVALRLGFATNADELLEIEESIQRMLHSLLSAIVRESEAPYEVREDWQSEAISEDFYDNDLSDP